LKHTKSELIRTRREQGSDFHWLGVGRVLVRFSPPWAANGTLFGSGRDALRSLISHGKATRAWRRLWMPSYFCQEVVRTVRSCGLEVALYAARPDRSVLHLSLDFRVESDVLFVANTFGLHPSVVVDNHKGRLPETMEDHTHDPWSDWAFKSRADWCMASLRKVLPIPDGGVLWSPAGHKMPEEAAVTPARSAASAKKLAAMFLKTAYLKGESVTKEQFRVLAVSGEEALARGTVSGMPQWTRGLFSKFPIKKWRRDRLRNHAALVSSLRNVPWLTVLQPFAEGSCPFSGILVFDSAERREHVRKCLIECQIYPAILWLLEKRAVRGVPSADVDFSRRMLSIHCDTRYTVGQMRHVARLIKRYGSKA